MNLQVLDPTHERAAVGVQRAPRLATLEGATVGCISNGKEGTRGFFAHLATQLREQHGVREVIVRVKSNYSAPADAHIMAEAASWDAVVTGLGD